MAEVEVTVSHREPPFVVADDAGYALTFSGEAHDSFSMAVAAYTGRPGFLVVAEVRFENGDVKDQWFGGCDGVTARFQDWHEDDFDADPRAWVEYDLRRDIVAIHIH